MPARFLALALLSAALAAGCALTPEAVAGALGDVVLSGARTASPAAGASAMPAGTSAPGGTPPPIGTSPPRATADRPDDLDGYQVHVVYAVPSDLEDRRYDLDGTLARSVAAFDGWLFEQTGRKQRLRLDRAAGALDVTFVRLAETDAELRAEGAYQRDGLERILKRMGFTHPKKIYAVYYDGTHGKSCGDGPWPPELPGTVAAQYLRAHPEGHSQSCDANPWSDGQAPTYREFSMLHEILHAQGFTPTCAGHNTRRSHTSFAPTDIMYAGDEPWRPSVLDGGGEIYGHGRAGCLDLAKSVFLTPTATDAAAPPLWEKAIAERR